MKAYIALTLCLLATTALCGSPFITKHEKASVAGLSADQLDPPAQVGYFDQTLSHFDFTVGGTFKQKYLYSMANVDKDSAETTPIFVYCGNEGAIEMFWQNSGFVTKTLAKQFKAAIVFPEHRYFGDSMPFGNQSFTGDNTRFLSTEQALADYAIFLPEFKKMFNLEKSPVIAGGSYGGMLAAWIRMKYPNVFDGSIAASAPILFYTGVVDPYAFNEIVTNDYTQASADCSTTIRSSYELLEKVKSDSSVYEQLNTNLDLCSKITSATDVEILEAWLSNAFTYMAMTDYPYPTSFLEPMPGWPVKAACKALDNIMDATPSQSTFKTLLDKMFHKSSSGLTDAQIKMLQATVAAANVYYNTTGEASCNKIDDDSNSGGLGMDGWDYLACTEQVMPIGSNGKTDMFNPQLWNLKEDIAGCEEQWNVSVRPYWVLEHYGGMDYKKDFQMYSNIVFSNGALDPWHAGSPLETVNDSVVAFVMADSAHHLDLRTPNPADPASVVKGRETEIEHITKWIKEAEAKYADN